MTASLSKLIALLAKAQSPATAAKILRLILSTIRMETNALSSRELIGALHAVAFSKIIRFRAQDPQSHYYIATGMEANLIYIVSRLQYVDCSTLGNLKAILRQYITVLSTAPELPLPGLNHISPILDHCYAEFPCLHGAVDLQVIAIPNIDIGYTAEQYYDSEIPIMIVNGAECADGLLESFAYESVALLIANEEPDEQAMDLLQRTTSPEIWRLREEDAYGDYIMSLKLGLAYHGPYEDFVERLTDNEDHARAWAEYLLALKP